MGTNFKIRLGVGIAEGRHSAEWAIFSTGNELYACHRTSGHIEKFSFHSSCICRRAYVDGRRLPSTMSDRVLHKWIRAETPHVGASQAVAVLTVVFPEGHLTPDLLGSSSRTVWLPTPKKGQASVMQLLFTRETEYDVVRLLGERHVVAYHRLPNGEAVVVRNWVSEFEERDLIVEASRGEGRDLVLPSGFEGGIRRSVSFTTYAQPDEMRCIELSGYWLPAGEGLLRFPNADTISRTQVVERTASQE